MLISIGKEFAERMDSEGIFFCISSAPRCKLVIRHSGVAGFRARASEMSREYFASPITFEEKSIWLITFTNDYDGIVLDQENKIAVFNSLQDLETFARNSLITIDGKSFHRNLDPVLSFLKEPRASDILCNDFIDAWNIFTDLSSTLRGENMDIQDDYGIEIYRKLFYGCNLPAVTPEGAHYEPSWKTDEVSELHKILSDKWTLFQSRLKTD